MPNYEKAKIYKIIDNTNGNIYIGSTCEKYLSRRLDGHKTKYKYHIQGKKNFRYTSSFDIIKNNDYKIILIENYSCKNKDELRMREQFYIDNTLCINKHNSYTSSDYKKQKMKENHFNNRTKICDRKKKHYKNFKSWGDSVNNILYIKDDIFLY